MKIIVENSTWNNIGDAWYQTSLYNLLKEMYPEHQVYMGEGPITRSFRIKSIKQKENALNLLNWQEADLHVFSGPILPQILTHYKNIIIDIKKRNAQYVLVSVSGAGMSNSFVNEVGAFLKQYPPLFFSSRDEETYKHFSPFVKNAYNGVCTAFFVNKTIPTQKFKLEKPFFISSFYTELEPFYFLGNNQKCTIENLQLSRKKTYLRIPYDYARHLNFLRTQQSEVGDHLIVRTIQSLSTKYNHINFALPNSFISFNPLTYLEVTNSSEFVVSDRVHACAIGLAFGKPVRFLFNTPRAGIFDRLGFDYKSNNGIIYPNNEIIDEEYNNLKSEIRRFIL